MYPVVSYTPNRPPAEHRKRNMRDSLKDPTAVGDDSGRAERQSLSEQSIQRGLGPLDLGRIFSDISPRLRLEVVAKVCLVLLADLFRGRFPAMLRVPDVVLDAHLADMQLSIARLAHLEPPQRQTQCRQRSTTAPTD